MVNRRFGVMHPITQIRDEVDRLFTGIAGNPAVAGAARMVNARAFPAINVWETGDEMFAEAEVPGMKSEHIDISVVGNELTIKGERPEVEQEGTTYHRRERGVGSFVRVLKLPIDVDAARVKAALTDGVLLITLPKAEAAKPRKIQVNAS